MNLIALAEHIAIEPWRLGRERPCAGLTDAPGPAGCPRRMAGRDDACLCRGGPCRGVAPCVTCHAEPVEHMTA
jgi:hypothetical protein